MKKDKFVVESLKPRNHVTMAMMKRNGAGTHEKSNKSKRQQEKVQLKKQLSF